jgi:hypothetical protein
MWGKQYFFTDVGSSVMRQICIKVFSLRHRLHWNYDVYSASLYLGAGVNKAKELVSDLKTVKF